MFNKRYLFLSVFLFVSYTAAGSKIEVSSSYSFDMLPTQISDNAITFEHSFSEKLLLKINSKYFFNFQPAHKGVKEHEASVISADAGLQINFSGLVHTLEVRGGVDQVIDQRLVPLGNVNAVLALGPDISLTTQGWYTGRITRAAVLLNNISSAGFLAELKRRLGPAGEMSISYRHEYFLPQDSLLDTALFEARPRGLADSLNVLDKNVVQTFSAYAYSGVLSPLYLGYAFEWKNALDSKYMITGEEDVIQSGGPRGPGGVVIPSVYPHMQYSNFPYAGTDVPLNRYAHNLIVSVPFSLGKLKVTGKTVFPFYSSQQKIDYDEYKDSFDPSIRYSPEYKYTEKFTAPMSAEVGAELLLNENSRITCSYDYFSFPYESWGYFSSMRYYLNTFRMKIDYEF